MNSSLESKPVPLSASEYILQNIEPTDRIAVLVRNRRAVIGMLRDMESLSPSLEDVQAMLPPSVRVLDYKPKAVPSGVAPISIVNNAGEFFRQYLRDLAWRLEQPDSCAAPPLADILAKLADAGLSLLADGNLTR